MSVTIAAVFGVLFGAGVYLLLRGAVPAAPRLDLALQRLYATPMPAAGEKDSPIARWLTTRIGPRLRIPTRELRLLGKSTERYVLEKVGLPVVGLLFVPVVTVAVDTMGLHLPVVVPVAGSLLLAALFFLLVDIAIKQQAEEAREQFVRAVAVYLSLVALERSAAHGPVESLERAAQVGTSWVFVRIRETLAAARIAGIPPWDGLSQVADEIGVPALGDVGDIMRLSGNEGAQVSQTLISRAQSLRIALQTKDHDRANTGTTLLYGTGSLMVMVLFVLVGYPFLIRLLA
ncbi:type II secretion system protein [Actinoplanes sp. SE50]|uniref:type II secretion system F family protein n=1 Tax=unclassified Actinoplanes TaxID=2626549 RepID=UPI00023ED675|nr:MULTISPECIES: type II secretion system F family protein [unclassified Actinoplanes]AEV86778.1 type II secretion system protein [Actinoplanes sp. SE50/110]ATO85175.1 type II secretion system protein [Actinoplanes sp. SE50]SLM02585.1 type II secretion system protein [Actinoplanes sp. SE50/110]